MGLDDAEAVQLLRLLVRYFDAYRDESPTDMTAHDLAGDLVESLPAERLLAAGLSPDRLVAVGLA